MLIFLQTLQSKATVPDFIVTTQAVNTTQAGMTALPVPGIDATEVALNALGVLRLTKLLSMLRLLRVSRFIRYFRQWEEVCLTSIANQSYRHMCLRRFVNHYLPVLFPVSF